MNSTASPGEKLVSLASAVAAFRFPVPTPLDISPWLAMSLLQKAIRRNRLDHAQRAAATLLRISPDRLWRRLGVIVVEDIGLGVLAVVDEVASALPSKRVRLDLGGEWAVASYLVARLARAPKCRASDDLLLVAQRHPAYLQSRLELGHYCREELAGIVAGRCCFVKRAIALLYLLGTDGDSALIQRRGEPQIASEALNRAGCSSPMMSLSQDMYRKTREPLGPLMALLSRETGWEIGIQVDDPFPPEVMVGQVPGWAYDMFTREGRAVFSRFISGKTKTARWLSKHVPAKSRLDVLGSLVFTLVDPKETPEAGAPRSASKLPANIGSDQVIRPPRLSPNCALSRPPRPAKRN